MSAEDLLQRLQLQAEANRGLQQQAADQRAAQRQGAYANAEQQTTAGTSYRQVGNASVPEGTGLAANFDPTTGEVVWVETYSSGESGSQLGDPVPCASGVDCLDSNFCYGWYECDPCDWCENNQCVPRDENRPCGATWECPCAPNEDQHYECVSGACRLTCETNDDCDQGEVCGLTTGFCGPGCQSDADCDPASAGAVGDAQPNTFCMGADPAEGLGGECVFPCDPVRFCERDADCFEGEYCGEREYRTASDPTGGIYQCISGCRDDSSCEDGETCDPESRSCYTACSQDSDCPEDEGCNDDGRCSAVGRLCVSSSDCDAGEYCSSDGRCAFGCRQDSDCDEPCDKVQSCADACPPEPSCSCEGAGCADENWRDYCERDPACLARCPDDPACVRGQGSQCIDNRCERTCSDSSQCLEDEVCSDGLCMVTASNEGDPADDRLGCSCGDVCNQFGTCEPVVCTADEQCPPCSICEGGACIEGCSEDNPCPDGQCCNPDGRCAKACDNDRDCATEPGNQLCLEGGCCGLICDPLVPCITRSDCGEGQFCGEEGYCLDGCFADSDCGEGERCAKDFVRLPNGAPAPCEQFPDEECYSDRGRCEPFCLSDSDCEEGDLCEDGRCQAPPPPACTNDADCEEGEICQEGVCSYGCRFDSQCEKGEVCRNNFCEQGCTSSEECAALVGEGSVCRLGYCRTVNKDEKGQGQGGWRGCECYEFCDQDGNCVPYSCSSDLECELEACGSCLAAGVCGACFTDSDCPGVKVCDRQSSCADDKECQAAELKIEGKKEEIAAVEREILEADVANLPTEVLERKRDELKLQLERLEERLEALQVLDPAGGICAYPCNPNAPGSCKGNGDCPEGFYCQGDQCQRGCAENSDCLPGSVCRGETCVNACTSDAQCPIEHRCVEGGCRFVGDPCDADNPQAQQAERVYDRERRKLEDLQDQQRLAADNLRGQEARIELLEDEIELAETQEQLDQANAYMADAIAKRDQYQAEVDELDARIEKVQGELDVLGLQLEEAKNRDCPSGQVCSGGYCEIPPPDCIDSLECGNGQECVGGSCRDLPEGESFRTFDPQVIGCESCAEVCDGGICRQASCQDSGDCSCGFCSGGRCLEECLTDLDCPAGVCDGGECIDCRTNYDCRSYGDGAVCDGGECKTPCFTGLSTGSCTQGLSYGDTCHSCPDRCPADAPCGTTNEVCGVVEVYDPITRRTRVQVTPCKQCSKSCDDSTDCEEGYICNGFGICVSSDGRCTFDSDCAEDALARGVEMRCRNNVCIEPGETCFTGSDCDLGEVCDEGQCVAGNCGDNNPCQVGKTCVDNNCRWQCGSGAEVFLCDDGQCPPGFYCVNDGTEGNYCLRPGMRFSEIAEPGCPVGELCCSGGCVPKTATFECCDADHCPGSQECCDGRCRFSCDDSTTQTDDDQGDIDDGEVEPQDNCERDGKCCQEDGWCGPCGCDDQNPCPVGQCCDRDSGVCVGISEHPNTKYGAPNACDLAPVFCELLGPEDGSETRPTIEPEQLGKADYKGCEVYDPIRQLSRCWEGGTKTPAQIQNLLRDACWQPVTKECKCDDIPAEDECATDADCGACGVCTTRTYRNDACCGIYGEGEYETTPVDGQLLTGVDFLRRNVCTQKDGEADECGCRSDADCTECEACQGGGPDRLGQCVAQCDERCPCGGELSRGGSCPSCQDRYGTCATEASYVAVPAGFDPVTGEEIAEQSGCACVLDRSKECCKGHASLEDLLYRRYRCQFQQQTYGDGTVEVLNTETCLDPAKDECAQCEVDAHCPGPQVCRGYRCVSECGKQQGDPDSGDRTSDRQDAGGIGGDPFTCWCCTENGECRAKYETWIESKAKQLGPWTITYAVGFTERTWRSQQEQLDAAVAEIEAAHPGEQVRIINTEGENNQGDCRPCECTDTGIECAPYVPCEGCYKWVPQGGEEQEVNRAELLRLEGELAQVENELLTCADRLAEQQELVTEAEGAYLSARQFFTQQDAILGAQLDALYAQEEAEQDLLNRTGRELWEKRQELAEIERRLAGAVANDDQPLMTLLSADLNSTEAEIEALEDSYDSTLSNLNQTQGEIDELERQLELQGGGSQAAWETLEQRRQTYQQLAAGLGSLQQGCDALRDQRGVLLSDLQKMQGGGGTSYTQERTCACCIDGSCRPESECTYGICYQCVAKYDGNYRAALYGKVLGQRISRDTPMPAGDKRTPRIKGATEWKYVLAEDTCVKYPCAGGWYREERPGYITNVRFYEYCTGSVLGCVLSYNKTKEGDYLQGWKYEVKLDDAGIFFTSDFVNWVKMGRYAGEGIRKAECLYNNPLGFMGASDLGTFYDLVATHPICNKAELYLECPPEEPFCQSLWEILYEAGDPDLQIKRLEREVAQLEALIKALEDAQAQLAALREAKLIEKEDLQQLLEEAGQQLAAAQAALQAAQEQLQTLEQQLAAAQANREALSEAFDDRLEAYVSIGDAYSAAVADREAAEQELSGAQYARTVARSNLQNAAAEANRLYLEANQYQLQIQQLRSQLAQTEPNTVEALELESLILAQEEQLADVQGQRSAIVADMLAYEEEIDGWDRLIDVSSCAEGEGGGVQVNPEEDCRSLRQRVTDAKAEEDQLFVFYGIAFGAYIRARDDLTDNGQLLSSLADQRNQVAASLQGLEQEIERLAALAGEVTYNPELCDQEGYAYRFVQTGGTINGQPIGQRRCCSVAYSSCETDFYPAGGYERECEQLCEQIKAIDAILENIRVSNEQVAAQIEESEGQKAEKKAEIEELQDGDRPTRLIGPEPRPTGKVKTAAELREELEQNIDVDRYLAEQDSWIPGATSEA